MKILILLRHVSGAGSTTLANILTSNHYPEEQFSVRSADQYFEDKNGNYNFDATKLYQAHHNCLVGVEDDMIFECELICVTNTFTTEEEISPYLKLALEYKYQVFSLIVEKRHDNPNQHGVPDETLLKQEKRFRNSIKLL